MFVRKLQSRSGGVEAFRPTEDDTVTFACSVFEYQPIRGTHDCKGRMLSTTCIEARLSLVQPLWLRHAILVTGGGMSAGERATFFVTVDAEACDEIQENCIMEVNLRAINHTLAFYHADAYDSLPCFEDAVQRLHDWDRIQSAFRAVKSTFAEYNKWDEYGIALLFKDTDMASNERLIDFNGSSIPWAGPMPNPMERALSARALRIWEGRILPYRFHLQDNDAMVVRDVTFEQEAASRLRGLGLVRLNTTQSSEADASPKVEMLHGRITITCSPETSNALLKENNLVPIMWEFRRFREGPSDRYRPTATRYRAQAGPRDSMESKLD